MASIIWDAIGSRTYQGGVDKGVLYLKNGTVVPWNGLVSVTEKATRSSTPIYFDGRKVMDLVEVGDFEATIEAITYPDEVLVLEGLGQMINGVYVGDQRPQLFNMSYQTKMGTDTLGQEAFYKIHMLYNVTAISSDKEYQTFSDDAEPMTFSWDITAIPEDVPGFKPSAHVVLDSRYVDPVLLQSVEDSLYGTPLTVAVCPSFEELMVEISAYDLVLTLGVDGDFTVSGTPVTLPDADSFMVDSHHVTIIDADTYSITTP